MAAVKGPKFAHFFFRLWAAGEANDADLIQFASSAGLNTARAKRNGATGRLYFDLHASQRKRLIKAGAVQSGTPMPGTAISTPASERKTKVKHAPAAGRVAKPRRWKLQQAEFGLYTPIRMPKYEEIKG